MGYTGAIVLAKSQADPDVLDELLTDLGFDGATPGPDGWLRAESEYAVESVDPAFAELIAERLDGPTLCGAVVQSDFAYVFVAEPGMAATSLVLSPAAVRATGAGLSEAEMRASAESFAIWSSHTPRSMSTDEVAKTTSRREVFAEDRLWDLIERLGLEMAATQSGVAGPPSFAVGLDGYLRAMDWMTDGFWCVDRGVSWADYRYVPGVGDGFIGIWDREAPDRPTRFADTREGRGKLIDRWEELRHPFELELAGATDFRGIVGLLPVESDLRPAGRLLPITQCRYVPGWGKGFAGVWDSDDGWRTRRPVQRSRTSPGRGGRVGDARAREDDGGREGGRA